MPVPDERATIDPEVVKTWEAKIAEAKAATKVVQDRIAFVESEAKKAYESRDESKRSAREAQARLDSAEAKLAAIEEYQRNSPPSDDGDPNDPETQNLRMHNSILSLKDEMNMIRQESQTQIQLIRIENELARAQKEFPLMSKAEIILQIQANPRLEIAELARISHENIEKGRKQWITEYETQKKVEADAEAAKKAAAQQAAIPGFLPPMPEPSDGRIPTVDEVFDQAKIHIRENQERLF